jgi:hypothetical protein
MSKAQSIIYLIIFIIVLFSMNQIFYSEIRNRLRETFTKMPTTGNQGGTGFGYIGKKLDYTTSTNINSMNGNVEYQNNLKSGFLGIEPPKSYIKNSDEHPLYYGFPSAI